jgi:anti-sigma regulatory factor (Ser/Thr protein kinase)
MCPAGDLGAGDRHWTCHRLPASPESTGTARLLARDYLRSEADEVLLEQSVLITSELITNAIKYGAGWRPLFLHLAVTVDYIAVTVADAGGEARIDDGGEGLPPHTSEGERGLHIVRELSDEFWIFHGPVTIVRAAQRREDSRSRRL